MVYAAQPREGTETCMTTEVTPVEKARFMQLNPARGRKLASRFVLIPIPQNVVYAAQPREGTETRTIEELYHSVIYTRFMQLNPARGRKQEAMVPRLADADEVYAAQPREGTETQSPSTYRTLSFLWFMQLNPARGRKLSAPRVTTKNCKVGLCSSTPRGDGNCPRFHSSTDCVCVWFMQLNPARGRKRFASLGVVINLLPRFMQLNPARGRKLLTPESHLGVIIIHGLCSSTPRGDGNFKTFLD